MQPEGGLEHETRQQGDEDDVGRDREANRGDDGDEQPERDQGDAERQADPTHRERDDRQCGKESDNDFDGLADRWIMHSEG